MDTIYFNSTVYNKQLLIFLRFWILLSSSLPENGLCLVVEWSFIDTSTVYCGAKWYITVYITTLLLITDTSQEIIKEEIQYLLLPPKTVILTKFLRSLLLPLCNTVSCLLSSINIHRSIGYTNPKQRDGSRVEHNITELGVLGVNSSLLGPPPLT